MDDMYIRPFCSKSLDGILHTMTLETFALMFPRGSIEKSCSDTHNTMTEWFLSEDDLN